MKELSSNPCFFLCQFFHETCEDSLTFFEITGWSHGPFNSDFFFSFLSKNLNWGFDCSQNQSIHTTLGSMLKASMHCTVMCPLHRSKASSSLRLSLSKCKGTIGMFHNDIAMFKNILCSPKNRRTKHVVENVALHLPFWPHASHSLDFFDSHFRGKKKERDQ
jgi:hypothetical protein